MAAKSNPSTLDASAKEATIPEPNLNPDMFCGVHSNILEAYDNLYWDERMPGENLKRHFIPPEEKTVSHAIKLLALEKAVFYTKPFPLPPLSEKEDCTTCYIPGLKPTHQIILPKMSLLNIKEQRTLFRFYHRMVLKNINPLNEQELSEFQTLRAKVAGEYADFQEFAKSEWYKSHWKRTLYIPAEVEVFLGCLWKMRAGQCMKVYPDYYKILSQIPLTLNDPNEDYSVMTFVREFHSVGSPFKVVLPKIRKPVELISSFEDLCRLKPVSGDLQPKPIVKSIPRVSLDHNVDKILEQKDVDIDVVISMSGIKTLLEKTVQREWYLPVTVKMVHKGDGAKKVVIIDKKLPPKSMSVHDMNLWHAKIVAKWILIFHSNSYLLDDTEKATNSNAEEDSFEDLIRGVEKLTKERTTEKVELKTEQLPENSQVSVNQSILNQSAVNQETAGHGQPKVTEPSLGRCNQEAGCKRSQTGSLLQNKRKTRFQERENLVSYDDPFNDCVVEDIEKFGVNPAPTNYIKTQEKKSKRKGLKACSQSSNETIPATKIPETVANTECTKRIDPESGESPQRMIRKPHVIKIPETVANTECTKRMDPESGESPQRMIRKPHFIKRGMLNPSLQYRLWSLHKSRCNKFLKLEQRSLNVLVRTRKDVALIHPPLGKKVVDEAYVSSKLEFQPEFGASKMTASELKREYLDLYMRPNTRLVRVRSIGHTKEVMLTEVKTISDIRDALQIEIGQSKKLLETFDPLYAVLTKLMDLSPGRYMLQHLAKMGPFVHLRAENPGWANFDLSHYCRELTKVEVNVPPVPIDPLVLTALHHRDKVPPALFKPLPAYRNSGYYFSKPQGKHHQKKKRRLRKTKSNK